MQKASELLSCVVVTQGQGTVEQSVKDYWWFHCVCGVSAYILELMVACVASTKATSVKRKMDETKYQ